MRESSVVDLEVPDVSVLIGNVTERTIVKMEVMNRIATTQLDRKMIVMDLVVIITDVLSSHVYVMDRTTVEIAVMRRDAQVCHNIVICAMGKGGL